MQKKAAIEMSIGTIVVIVLAMSMLILGLILVKNIFTGATYNVNSINDKVRDEIGRLFVENKKTVVYLPNSIAEIEQNNEWGVAFAIKNLNTGTAQASSFSYEVVISDPDATSKCGISERTIENWISTGRSDTNIDISPGQTFYGLVRFNIPDNAPICTVRFHLNVKADGETYAVDFFDVRIIP